MKFICSLIVVADIKKSRHLFEGVFGMKVKSDFGENVTFEGDFAIHQKDHFEGLIDGKPVTQKSNSFELYFEEDDIEGVVKKLETEGLEFVHPMREQPWRQRVVRVYDYDGNIIEIGETMTATAKRLLCEGKSVEEVAEITYLPEEVVAGLAVEESPAIPKHPED